MLDPTESKLADLLDGLAEHYLTKLKTGEIDAKDASNIIALLKANDITCEPKQGTPLDCLTKTLPFNNGFGMKKAA